MGGEALQGVPLGCPTTVAGRRSHTTAQTLDSGADLWDSRIAPCSQNKLELMTRRHALKASELEWVKSQVGGGVVKVERGAG